MPRRPPRSSRSPRPSTLRREREPDHAQPGKPRPASAAPPAADRLGRPRPNDVWLFGRHAVEAALSNPRRRCRRLLTTLEAAAALETAAGRRALRPEPVTRADLDAFLPPGAVHQGVALQVDPLPPAAPRDVIAAAADRAHAVVVALDQVTDPHNVGAVLRSAAAFGALAVVVQDRHSPPETGVLAKAASGALERIPMVRVTNLVRALDQFRDNGFWTVGLAADAPVTFGRADLPERLVLVLGSEGEGLRRLTREHCDHLVGLPMVPGAVESLNVSNAAAVALYAVTHAHLEVEDAAAPDSVSER